MLLNEPTMPACVAQQIVEQGNPIRRARQVA
jgi:hypothetical protein